jgi:hypothetical protein
MPVGKRTPSPRSCGPAVGAAMFSRETSRPYRSSTSSVAGELSTSEN